MAEARITLKPSDERGISFPLGHDPANFGAEDAMKDPDTGRRLLKPVVGAYFWRLQGGTT